MIERTPFRNPHNNLPRITQDGEPVLIQDVEYLRFAAMSLNFAAGADRYTIKFSTLSPYLDNNGKRLPEGYCRLVVGGSWDEGRTGNLTELDEFAEAYKHNLADLVREAESLVTYYPNVTK